jgi:predicted aspartyl protease
MGKAYRIHAMVNNCQVEHYSTVLETSGMISDQHFSILIDPGATESFISSHALKIIKVNEIEQDEFILVELASRAKKKVGGKVKDCIINLDEFLASVNLFFTTLGSYDIVIGMDWLESHNAILNYKTKRSILIDELGECRVIIGRNQGVSLRFITSYN